MIKRFKSMYIDIDRPIPNMIVSLCIVVIMISSSLGIIVFGPNSLVCSIFLFGIIFLILYSIKYSPIFLFLRYKTLYKTICDNLCYKEKLLNAIDFDAIYDECKSVLEDASNTTIDVVYRESLLKDGFEKYSKQFRSKLPRHIKDEFELGLYKALLELDIDCDTSSDIAFVIRSMCGTILFANTILDFSDRSSKRVDYLFNESYEKLKAADNTSIESLIKANKEVDDILAEIQTIEYHLGVGESDDE